MLCMSWPRICLGFLLLVLLLAAGCVQPTPPVDAAVLKAEAIALAKEDPVVYKLERFASAFNDPTLRKVLSEEQDKILYELRYEAVLWGENRYRVNLFDSLGGKDNKAELWVLVDLKAKRVVEYSVDFSPESQFMDAVSKFLFAPANAKAKAILDSVSKFVPISSCEQWGGERDMCYGYLAVVKDNPYICDEIVNFDGKFTCVAAVTKNPPRCEAVNFANIPSCRILAITLTKDCLAYDPVKHEGETASLQDRCLVLLPEKATAFGPSLCEMISDPAYKQRCQDSVAFNHQDNELCDKMDNASRKVCRALALRDPKYCKKPNSEEFDEGCVVLLAKKAKNEEFCGVLPNPDACYKEVAIAKQDKALCDQIDLGNADARKGCYTFTSDWKPSKLIKGYIPYTAMIPTGVGA